MQSSVSTFTVGASAFATLALSKIGGRVGRRCGGGVRARRGGSGRIGHGDSAGARHGSGGGSTAGRSRPCSGSRVITGHRTRIGGRTIFGLGIGSGAGPRPSHSTGVFRAHVRRRLYQDGDGRQDHPS